MHLPLVSSVSPASKQDNAHLYPRLNADGAIAMDPSEKETDRVFFVDYVGVFDVVAGKLKRTFRAPSEPTARPWEVHVTNERLIVRKCSSSGTHIYAGHVPYGYAHMLSAIYCREKPILALCVTHADKTISALALSTSNETTLRRILKDLHQSIDVWLDTNNRRLTPWGISDQKYQAQCEAWRNYLSSAWTDGGQVVLVPCDMAALIPSQS